MSSRTEQIEARSEKLILPILEEQGFELVDIEYVREAGNWYLRAYIDKPGGITVDDCELVSRAFDKELDREDYIEDSYTMEISSPGLGRPLRKEKDFRRAVGKKVEARTYKPVDGSRIFSGILQSYDAENVTLDAGESTWVFARKDLALIRMDDWEENGKK